MGQYTEALKAFSEALSIQQALGNRWWEAIAWNETGIVRMLVGEYRVALDSLNRALFIAREIAAEVGEAYIQVNLGQVLRDMAHFSEAEAALMSGLRFAIQRKDRHLEAICHSDLAFMHIGQENHKQAIDEAMQAQLIYAEIGMLYSATADFATAARSSLALGNLAEAGDYADRVLKLLSESGGDGPDFPHRDYWHCAQVLRAVGRLEDAENAVVMARRVLQDKAEKISDPLLRASFLENVSFNREILA